MSHQLRSRIHQEVELIQRFAGSYGKKFDDLIKGMNCDAPAANSDKQSLRLCIEAVNMVLSLQGQLASVLDDLSRETEISKSNVLPRSIEKRITTPANLSQSCVGV